MFVPDSESDKTCLRQGDILEDIPFPLVELKNLAVIGTVRPGRSESEYPALDAALRRHRSDPNYFTAQIPARLCFCAIISHCCEIEPRNGKLLPACFTVARLIKIKQNIIEDSTKLASLRANKDPRSGDPGYVDYFYIESHERLRNTEWMVDFSQALSIPNTEFPDVLTRKILQMEDRERVKFKIKLAVYVARITDEEDGAGLRDPWV